MCDWWGCSNLETPQTLRPQRCCYYTELERIKQLGLREALCSCPPSQAVPEVLIFSPRPSPSLSNAPSPLWTENFLPQLQ